MRFPKFFRANAWKELRWALWLPIYLLSFLLLEQYVSFDSYWDTRLPIDALIPFCEWFVIPYCLWYPFMALTGIYLLFRDAPAFRRYMVFMAVTFFASVIIWAILPNGQSLRPEVFPRENIWTGIIGSLYSIDTSTNVFPSVHVVGSVGTALALWDAKPLRHRPWLRWGGVLLAALICASTVLIKQHAFIDVIGGLLLSSIVAHPVYHRAFRAAPHYRLRHGTL